VRAVAFKAIANIGIAAALLSACAGPAPVQSGFSAPALVREMRRRPVVLLGEIHDNAAQHRVRAGALRQLLQGGARPALAFEQFDRERQPDIDRIVSGGGADRLERLVALGVRGWDWDMYRPYLELALQYGLPIVAADLSRADAMRVSRDGYQAVFDAGARARLGLDSVPEDLLREQEKAVDEGHCHKLPAQALPAIARAQIARDAALAAAIEPYLAGGVVLLAGNGHARRDIGVPRFLPQSERSRLISIGLIENDAGAEEVPPGAYDSTFLTPVQTRPDPCESLHLDFHSLVRGLTA